MADNTIEWADAPFRIEDHHFTVPCEHCGGTGFEPMTGKFRDSHACSVCKGEGETYRVLDYLDAALDGADGLNAVGMIREWAPFWIRVAPEFGVAQSDDGVRIEWECDGWDCSLEIAADGSLYAHRFSVGVARCDVGRCEEVELDTFDSDEATRLVSAWTGGPA